MAENKKSFIAYSDWHCVFQELPDEFAGKLIKHIFSYVNDEDPESDNFMVNALFAQIKTTLKRDLAKWDGQREQRSFAGKKSAELRAQRNPTKSNERSTVVESEKKKPDPLLSAVNVDSDVDPKDLQFYKIAIGFDRLFRQNSEKLKIRWAHLDKTKYKKAITPIRLLIETDKRTYDEILEVYKFLETDAFWMKNIQTTDKLREKFDTLITQAKNKNNGAQQQFTRKTADEHRNELIERLSKRENDL